MVRKDELVGEIIDVRKGMRAGNSGGVPQNADHVSNLYIVMYAVNYTQLRTTNGWYKPSTYGWFNLGRD